ncbi:MAG: nucleotidyltransferase family protein [Nitrososphaerota archaeon]
MIALILAGGLGKRLRPLTDKTPKPLIEVGGKAVAEWQLEWLVKHGFRRVVFCVSYLADKFVERFGDGSSWGIEISYSVEKELLGTAGGLKNAKVFCSGTDKLLLVNGDIITNLDPKIVISSLEGAVGAVSLVPLPSIYGVVKFDAETLKVREFREKPIIEDYWINAGVYGFNCEIFDHLPEKGSLEIDVLPKLASEEKLKAVPFKNVFWKSIETYKDLEEVEKFLVGGGERGLKES